MADENPARCDPDPEPSSRAYEAARLHLARLRSSEDQPLWGVIKQVTVVAAATLRVERVSVWRLLDEGRAIRCDFLYQPTEQVVSEGTILFARDFPDYFRSLAARRVISTRDVADDPLAQEFREAYLRPLGITAMLDAPIYQAGEQVGIVCHEHTGSPRTWTLLEREFVASIADTIGRLYEEDARQHAASLLVAYQARAMELERLGSMGQLAAGVAHDFRNLLTTIYGFTDLIAAAAADNSEVIRMIHEIQAAAERANRLTEELLALARAEPRTPGVVDVGQLLTGARLLLATAAGSSATLSLSVTPQLGRVFLDANALERVLLNLVINARDAMPDGGAITLSAFEVTHPSSADGGRQYVVLEVKDSGGGIDPATLPKIFEPFFTTKGAAGAGLGLAIVQQLITAAGGFVTVESVLGAGAAVRVYLPRIAAPA